MASTRRDVSIFFAGFCCCLVFRNIIAPVSTEKENYSFTNSFTGDNISTQEALRDTSSNSAQETEYLRNTTEYLWNGKELFVQAAYSSNPVTDKVKGHSYQTMYGKFLLPYYHQNPTMKFLEIGLGCDMSYGPGASVHIYKQLFPRAELWEAEFVAECVEKHRNGKLKGINLLVGDQGNDTVLDEWIEQSGGNFDVIIDDGGHQNCQIWHSFLKLWPTVKPGGLYFIEDMHVARLKHYRKANTEICSKDLIVPDKLKGFIDNLLYQKGRNAKNIEFVFCQSQACVLGKRK